MSEIKFREKQQPTDLDLVEFSWEASVTYKSRCPRNLAEDEEFQQATRSQARSKLRYELYGPMDQKLVQLQDMVRSYSNLNDVREMLSEQISEIQNMCKIKIEQETE